MKVQKEKLKSRNRGITLIALVITIIVLLILAGISISMLSGDNSILQKATDAKANTEKAQIIESAQTDILGQQAENKGTDITKEQLATILNKYFRTVKADEIPDEVSTTNDLTLTTLDEKYEIKLSEIFVGNLVEDARAKAATLFENKAGDEDGATEGKIHIGDYVNYNPIAQGDTGTEDKYKYSSLNTDTGLTEAIAANVLTGFTDLSQNFTTKSNLRWQVIGVDGNNILITTETPIKPDNPPAVQVQTGPSSYETRTGYFLFGAKAYINCSPVVGERNEINNIAQIYKNGKGADSSKTRGMTIEDVNNLAGVIVDGSNITPSEIYYVETGYEYGTTLTDFKKGTKYGWTPESWLDPNVDKTNDVNAPGYSGKITGYQYSLRDSHLKPESSAIRSRLLTGDEEYESYLLASRGIRAADWGVLYGVDVVRCSYDRWVGPGNDFTPGGGGEVLTGTDGIRPVIYLNSSVSLTSTGTENGITTWNID